MLNEQFLEKVAHFPQQTIAPCINDYKLDNSFDWFELLESFAKEIMQIPQRHRYICVAEYSVSYHKLQSDCQFIVKQHIHVGRINKRSHCTGCVACESGSVFTLALHMKIFFDAASLFEPQSLNRIDFTLNFERNASLHFRDAKTNDNPQRSENK